MLMSPESMTEVEMTRTHACLRRSGTCWDFFMSSIEHCLTLLLMKCKFLEGLCVCVFCCTKYILYCRPITADICG